MLSRAELEAQAWNKFEEWLRDMDALLDSPEWENMGLDEKAILYGGKQVKIPILKAHNTQECLGMTKVVNDELFFFFNEDSKITAEVFSNSIGAGYQVIKKEGEFLRIVKIHEFSLWLSGGTGNASSKTIDKEAS